MGPLRFRDLRAKNEMLYTVFAFLFFSPIQDFARHVEKMWGKMWSYLGCCCLLLLGQTPLAITKKALLSQSVPENTFNIDLSSTEVPLGEQSIYYRLKEHL